MVMVPVMSFARSERAEARASVNRPRVRFVIMVSELLGYRFPGVTMITSTYGGSYRTFVPPLWYLRLMGASNWNGRSRQRRLSSQGKGGLFLANRGARRTIRPVLSYRPRFGLLAVR